MTLDLNTDVVRSFCRKNRIRRLSLFGSVSRGEDRPDSDVDLLVEFEIDAHVGYFKLGQIEIELSEMFGRKVDLRTPAELSRYFRQEVVDAAIPIYAA